MGRRGREGSRVTPSHSRRISRPFALFCQRRVGAYPSGCSCGIRRERRPLRGGTDKKSRGNRDARKTTRFHVSCEHPFCEGVVDARSSQIGPLRSFSRGGTRDHRNKGSPVLPLFARLGSFVLGESSDRRRPFPHKNRPETECCRGSHGEKQRRTHRNQGPRFLDLPPFPDRTGVLHAAQHPGCLDVRNGTVRTRPQRSVREPFPGIQCLLPLPSLSPSDHGLFC
mmetsp:Transcript_6434/g.15874  ORF Transcript_6434/g.15874 Transcript_6434/m.15874 type:complete len:225 (-) Transcript_6434:697-1371(-)